MEIIHIVRIHLASIMENNSILDISSSSKESTSEGKSEPHSDKIATVTKSAVTSDQVVSDNIDNSSTKLYHL